MMQSNVLHAYSPPSPRESIATLGRILFWQTIAGLAFSLAAFAFAGSVAGTSALIGAGLCLLPNFLFALRLIPGMFEDSAQQVMNSVYTAELFKVAATVLLFVLVFLFVNPLRPDMLFIGFMLTQFSIILAAWMAN